MRGGIIVIDNDRRILGWNRWSETTWGLQAQDVLGTRLEALETGIPVHDLSDGVAAVQTGRSDHVDQALNGVDRRGRPIHCRVRISGLLDEKGERIGIVLVFLDITG
jgi:two-component system CheB/CheR fusion protein